MYSLYKYAKETEKRMMLIEGILKEKDKEFKGITIEERMERIDRLIAEKDFKTASGELELFIDKGLGDKTLFIDARYKLGTTYISMREDTKGIRVLEDILKL